MGNKRNKKNKKNKNNNNDNAKYYNDQLGENTYEEYSEELAKNRNKKR